MADITTNQVWQAIEKQVFAVLGMVSAKNQSRTVGIVYSVHNRKLYIASENRAWKNRHISQNPHVSLTIPIAKRIPLMGWIKIPAATITFSGTARVLPPADVADDIVHDLFRGMETNPETSRAFSIIEVTPVGDFITYGVGVPLLTMRDTEKARGRVAVG